MKKSCTLLPSGIWLLCILFVSLNFFLFPHGMFFFFFSCVLPLGCEWPASRCLLARDTARAVKQGHASKGLWGIWHLPATLETTRWSLASLARSHASPLETRKFHCSCPNTSEMLFAGYGCGSRNESVTKGGWQDERLECGSKYTDVTYEFSIIASHSLFFYNDQSRRPLSITLSCLLHSLQSLQSDFLAWLHEEENVTLPDNTTHKITRLST